MRECEVVRESARVSETLCEREIALYIQVLTSILLAAYSLLLALYIQAYLLATLESHSPSVGKY